MYNPSLGNELAIGFTNFIDALKSLQSYLLNGIQLKSAYEYLKKCFVAVIIVLDAGEFTEYRTPGWFRVKAPKLSKALLSLRHRSIYLEQQLEALHQSPLLDAMARNPRATQGLPQSQWTASLDLLARLERVEAALNLSMPQSNGTTISQAAVQDAMAETRAWVIRSADATSMHSDESRGEADVHVVRSSY